MKILQIIPYYVPAYTFGGPISIVHQISKQLVKRGHEVVVYTSNAESHSSRLPLKSIEILNGVEIHYFRNITSKTIGRLFITPQLILTARKQIDGFDIVHLHGYRTFQNLVACYYANRNSVPCVLQAHGMLPVLMNRQLLKIVFDKIFGNRLVKSVEKLIALTETEQKQFELLGVSTDRIEIIPNGIDLARFQKVPLQNTFRKKFGIPPDMRIILYLGRLHKYKGIDILVMAFARLRKKRDDVILVIAGPDHGALNPLRELCSVLDISGSVIFPGSLLKFDKFEAFVDADIFVLPSLYEAFPIVLLEAFAFSKPVIASDIDSISGIIEHGENGFLFKSSEVDSLEQSIKLLLDNHSLAHDLGTRARKCLEEQYTISDVVIKMERMYRNCIESFRNR